MGKSKAAAVRCSSGSVKEPKEVVEDCLDRFHVATGEDGVGTDLCQNIFTTLWPTKAGVGATSFTFRLPYEWLRAWADEPHSKVIRSH